ncbi:hypothetical protein Ddye_001509 [Dipteronia dyeriana]|uniref:Uncharacterized protein n=1 Tax=Dipteronia dyeriana TaxID=168575 RepID=A0AAE0CTF6_9ROSI|nr:hypothetical protein Ddye_001509 [Dipteronia dyeriana]
MLHILRNKKNEREHTQMIKYFMATVYHRWVERYNRIFKLAQISNQRTEKQIKLDVKQRFSGNFVDKLNNSSKECVKQWEISLNHEMQDMRPGSIRSLLVLHFSLSVQPETRSVFCLL